MTRIPATCKTMTDVEAFLADKLGRDVHIEVKDPIWGVADVFVFGPVVKDPVSGYHTGVDLEYVGRLDDDTFYPETS